MHAYCDPVWTMYVWFHLEFIYAILPDDICMIPSGLYMCNAVWRCLHGLIWIMYVWVYLNDVYDFLERVCMPNPMWLMYVWFTSTTYELGLSMSDPIFLFTFLNNSRTRVEEVVGRTFALQVADPVQFPGPHTVHPPAPPGVISEHEQEYALSSSRFSPLTTEINNSRDLKEVDTQRPLCRGCRPCGNLLVGLVRESGCGRLGSLVPQVFGFHLPSGLPVVGTLVASGSEREKLSP